MCWECLILLGKIKVLCTGQKAKATSLPDCLVQNPIFFTLSNDKDLKKNCAFAFVFIQCKWTLAYFFHWDQSMAVLQLVASHFMEPLCVKFGCQLDVILFIDRSWNSEKCNSMPLGARRTYYGKVRIFLSAGRTLRKAKVNSSVLGLAAPV